MRGALRVAHVAFHVATMCNSLAMDSCAIAQLGLFISGASPHRKGRRGSPYFRLLASCVYQVHNSF